MPRIPLPDQDDFPTELAKAIRSRRGGNLLQLDRMLLHSPPFARGWNDFLGAVRKDLTLSPRLRELVICAIAVLNRAEYEFEQHAPEFLRAGGRREQLDSLRQGRAWKTVDPCFNPGERAVLQLAEEMTLNVTVSDATFAAARAALPDTRQLVELVGVIATYNLVSRFLVALGIESEIPD